MTLQEARDLTTPELHSMFGPRRRRPRAAATTEFGAALITLRIKQRSAARWFRTSERNIRRWKSGDRHTPPAVGIVCNLLAMGVVTVEQVEAAALVPTQTKGGGAEPEPPAPLEPTPTPAEAAAALTPRQDQRRRRT
jgi:hypothetical protein